MSTSSVSASVNRPLRAAFDHAIEYLSTPQIKPVGATATLSELRQQLGVALTADGIDATTVVTDLIAACRGGLHRSSGSRFFAWVVGGALPASLAADVLTSAWDQNAGLFAVAPAASVVEEIAGTWLKELLNIPMSASYAFVSGCQLAHFTALAAARHALLARAGWDVEEQGLSGSPLVKVFTSSEVHGSSTRAIRLLGLGSRNVEKLQADDMGHLSAAALTDALTAAGDTPKIVILQAGDLNLGAYDDFATLIPIAHEHNAWVHIDGAFGLWASASPRFRHLMRGAELADSWATDGHKWLNVPYDSGFAFVAHAKDHRAAMTQTAAYITSSKEARDQMDWNPEWSRRARGFATYAALRELGRNGVTDLIDRCCDVATALTSQIGSLPGAQALSIPVINQGMVRFLSTAANASQKDNDAYTDRMIEAINAEGTAFFSGTTWRGQRAMRISVCNWQTNMEDVAPVVAAIAEVLRLESSKSEKT